MSHYFFISDIHLDESRPDITETFFLLLQKAKTHAERLYILGDLFEVWVGDDAQTELHRDVADKLYQLSQKIPVYFLPGNRDFLVGDSYLKQAGMQRLNDPQVINVYGVSTLLTHGDSLCTADRLHQWFRRITNNRWTKKIFLLLPLSWRKRIAAYLRKKSHRRQFAARENPQWDVVDGSLKKCLRQYQAKSIIYGHTHKPSIRLFFSEHGFTRCVVLSDWSSDGNVLICSANGTKKLMSVVELGETI